MTRKEETPTVKGRLDKHSATGRSRVEGPAKEGGGGKYTWGDQTICTGPTGAEDPKDPNYDSDQ